MDNYLSHHGILGQKWGVRRYQNADGSLTIAGKERYSSDQYKRDSRVYGRSGANRIRRHISKGDSVSGARSMEADRINAARNRATTAGHVGRVIGGVSGAVGGYLASQAVMRKMSMSAFSDPALQMAVGGIVAAGAASVGNTLGSYGGQSIAMLASGYSPSKFR